MMSIFMIVIGKFVCFQTVVFTQSTSEYTSTALIEKDKQSRHKVNNWKKKLVLLSPIYVVRNSTRILFFEIMS